MAECDSGKPKGRALSLPEVMEEPLQMHSNAAHVKSSKEDGVRAIAFSLCPLVLVLKGPQLPFVPLAVFFELSPYVGYSRYVFSCALNQVLPSSWDH